jgi:hypothetical protein
MNITIKSLTGKLIKVNVKETDTIRNIKEQVQEMEGIEPDQQRLVLHGLLLANDTKISDTKIVSGSVLNIVLALRGGSTKPNSNSFDEESKDEISQLIDTDIYYEINFQNSSITESYEVRSIVNTTHNYTKLCCAIL